MKLFGALLLSALILGWLAFVYSEKYVVDDNVLKIMFLNLEKTEIPLNSIKAVGEKPSSFDQGS